MLHRRLGQQQALPGRHCRGRTEHEKRCGRYVAHVVILQNLESDGKQCDAVYADGEAG